MAGGDSCFQNHPIFEFREKFLVDSIQDLFLLFEITTSEFYDIVHSCEYEEESMLNQFTHNYAIYSRFEESDKSYKRAKRLMSFLLSRGAHHGGCGWQLRKVRLTGGTGRPEGEEAALGYPVVLSAALPSSGRSFTPAGFDGSFYPPGMESVSRKLAIVRANRSIVDNSQFLIAYARYTASNARELVEYAMKREKRA